MEPSARRLIFWLGLGAFAVVVGAVALGSLHDSVIACTVGFRAAGQPLGSGAASACPAEEVASATFMVICLSGAAVVIGFTAKWLHASRSAGATDGVPAGAAGVDRREGPGRAPPEPLVGRSYPWVALMVVVFFAASFAAASWEYLRLSLNNFQDVATNQQALSSAIFGGRPYPFYEAFNCGHHGQCSFLEVHQVFLAYAIAPLYSVAPTAFTLFAIQSLVLGLGALPLYGIAVDVIGSRRWPLVVAGAYLAWFPLFAGAFSFHWEAFIPVETFTLFWLWNRQKYLLATLVVLLSFVTIEATTVLIFFVGLYFLWPWLVRGARRLFTDVFRRSDPSRRRFSRLRGWGASLAVSLRVPAVYAPIALMAGSLAAYVLLRLFVLDWAVPLGFPPVPPAYALPLISPNKDFIVTWAGLTTLWTTKLTFWVVVFLTLGFVPLFAPRTLLLVLPWIVFTVFNATSGYFHFGDQYLFVAAGALFIGFTFGLERLLRPNARRAARRTEAVAGSAAPTTAPPVGAKDARASRSPAPSRRRRGRARPSPTTVVLSLVAVLVIGGNLFLSPLDPLAGPIVTTLGAPFPAAYGVDYGPLPDLQSLEQLVSVIPEDAVVAAPLPVFSLVADDPYAYPLIHFNNPPYNDSLLPGNETAQVEYVLLPYSAPAIDVPPPLFGTLYDRSIFGVRGCVADSEVGGVELFQRSYVGPSQTFGPADALCPNYYEGGAGLMPAKYANVTANSSSPSGVVVRSDPCNGTATVFTGPGISLPRGSYDLHIVLDAFNSTEPSCPIANLSSVLPLLNLSITGRQASGTTWHHFDQLLQFQLCSPECGDWIYWNSTFSLKGPTSDLSFTGTVAIQQYVLQVAYLLLLPIGS